MAVARAAERAAVRREHEDRAKILSERAIVLEELVSSEQKFVRKVRCVRCVVCVALRCLLARHGAQMPGVVTAQMHLLCEVFRQPLLDDLALSTRSPGSASEAKDARAPVAPKRGSSGFSSAAASAARAAAMRVMSSVAPKVGRESVVTAAQVQLIFRGIDTLIALNERLLALLTAAVAAAPSTHDAMACTLSANRSVVPEGVGAAAKAGI